MEDLEFLKLWDIYSPLLTKTQQEITNLYFNCDLSLAEIAEEKGCSRQSVSDCLNKCRKQLQDLEEKLRFSKRLTELNEWAQTLPDRQQKALATILAKDYTREVTNANNQNAKP